MRGINRVNPKRQNFAKIKIEGVAHVADLIPSILERIAGDKIAAEKAIIQVLKMARENRDRALAKSAVKTLRQFRNARLGA